MQTNDKYADVKLTLIRVNPNSIIVQGHEVRLSGSDELVIGRSLLDYHSDQLVTKLNTSAGLPTEVDLRIREWILMKHQLI